MAPAPMCSQSVGEPPFRSRPGFVMSRRRWLATMPVWAGLLAAACSPQPPPAAAPAAPRPVGLRTARVWFLHEPDATAPDAIGAPMLFANGEPLGRSRPATAFFHDFRPGRYRFSAGSPDGSGTGVTFQLAAGMESYLLVRAASAGSGAAGQGAFALSALPSQAAKQALPALADLGRR